ncbi:MAG: energy transducer TonB [Myxococcota bacterium]
MFDNIGKDLDEQANRRRAESVLYTTLIVGTAVGIFTWFTARAVVEVAQQLEDYDLVQVDALDDLDDAAPPPPPPPPAGDDEEEEEEVEEPDEVVEEVQELKEIVEKPIEKAKEQKGQKGGHELGVAGGKVGGTVGGDPNSPCEPGDPRCTGLGRMVSYKDVKVKNMIQPTYPVEARSLNLGEQRCRVTVSIDTKGVPSNVRVRSCPEVFHEEVKRAMFKSRWWPYKSGGAKQAAQFTILITFRLS